MTVLGLVVRHYYFLWPQPSNKQSQRNLLEIADHGGKIGQNSLNNIAGQCLYVAMCYAIIPKSFSHYTGWETLL